MATSKTLTPTNVTIQIPAMTDAPDQSVNSNCIDKLGDAVNALNSQISGKANVNKGSIANGGTANVTITRPCLVLVGRASSATTGTIAFVDGWGIIYLQNNGIYALSIADDTLTISNTSGAYCSFMVVQ